jgi:hypothetical protein
MNGHTRGSIIRRGLLLAGGAVGLGAGVGITKELAGDDGTLTLTSSNAILHNPERRPGERIRAGDRGTVRGDLTDGNGRAVGTFQSTRIATDDGTMEQHVFRLGAGALFGMGTILGTESFFTIVGGTGEYAGARGTYGATQRLRELGGDGSAEFNLNLSV